MTSPNLSHTAYNNNSRPAYNANANNHPAYNANAYKAPTNNEAHYTPAPHVSEPPAHQGGGGQPHNESHPSGGGGEHEHR